MYYRYFILVSLLLAINLLSSATVEESTAREVAYKWWQFACYDQPSFEASEVIPVTKDGQPLYYILNARTGGFVLVAANDSSVPILGFSKQGKFTYPIASPEAQQWFEQLETALTSIINNRLDNQQTLGQWSNILTEYCSNWRTTRNVEPLLTTTWDQANPYNSQCPLDASSPAGGYAWAGCGAAAMAQIMRYWSYPLQGSGSRTYTSPLYGQISANFGQTTYAWDNMPSICTTENQDIPQLLYHCAVSLNTQFGPTVSTFQTLNMPTSFYQYFDYNMPTYRNRISFDDEDWHGFLKTNIDAYKPVIYFGAHTGISHLYIIDGYQNDDYYHVNWCWGGLYDGYYYLDNLNPGGVDYGSGQGGIFDISPQIPVPIRPSNLAAEFVSNYLINLTWQDMATNETGYRIERKAGTAETWSFLANVGPNSVFYSDTDMESFTSYYYRVRAYNGSGNSSWSNEVYSITSGVIAPVQLSVSSGLLSWTTSPNAMLYNVYQSDNPLDAGDPGWTLLGQTGATSYQINMGHSRKFYNATALSAVEYPQSFVSVQGGTFFNGTSNITLSSFYIDKYEVTQNSYQYIMGVNPSGNQLDPYFPVEKVTWFKAVEYCNRRSILEGLTPCYSYLTYGTNPDVWPAGWNTDANNHLNIACNWSAMGYRLPTEMEWMYAARGGTLTHNYTYSGGNDPGPVSWYSSNSGSSIHVVGTKAANELGLQDMSGNVVEWVWDIYAASYPASPQTNPHGATTGGNRCRRGGGYSSGASSVAVSARSNAQATTSIGYLGFRLVRNAP